MLISTNQIVPNPDQPRTFFDEEGLRALARSLAEDGLLNPIAVEGPVDGWYILEDGERRWRAALLVGWTEIEAHVRPVKDSSARRLLLALVGNLQRSDMGAIDVATAYAKLNKSMTVAEIAERVGRTESHVYQMMALLNSGLIPFALASLNQGHIPLDYTMLRMLAEIDPDLQERIVRRAIRLKQSGRAMRYAIKGVSSSRRRQAQVKAVHMRLATGTPPAQVFANAPTVNGIGKALGDTCLQCGMAEDQMTDICRECPLVIFVRLYTAEALHDGDSGG